MDKLRRGQPGKMREPSPLSFYSGICSDDQISPFADRLPSGKEVEIRYLEEQRETVIVRGKHNPVKVTDNVHTAKNKDTAAPKKTKSKRK